jgi:hypothetical protein
VFDIQIALLRPGVLGVVHMMEGGMIFDVLE